MSLLTDYGSNYISQAVFGGQSPIPASWWMALTVAIPDPSADGTMLIEPLPTNGYARVQVPNDTLNWGPATGGVVANLLTIYFPSVTTTDWPAISAYVFCDDPVAGNIYLAGRLRVPMVATVGTRMRFDPGALVLSVNQTSPAIIPAS